MLIHFLSIRQANLLQIYLRILYFVAQDDHLLLHKEILKETFYTCDFILCQIYWYTVLRVCDYKEDIRWTFLFICLLYNLTYEDFHC